VAHHERLGDDAVDLTSEGKDENQHDAQHAGSEQMHLVALDRHPRDQRHEDRQHKAIERRLVHSGAGQAAEDHAELADDEQRLVGRRGGKHRDGGNAPEGARERCAHRPERAPACSIADRRIGAPVRVRQHSAPGLVGEDRRQPRGHHPRRLLLPHDAAQDERAEQHRRRRPMPRCVQRGNLIGSSEGSERRHGAGRGRRS